MGSSMQADRLQDTISDAFNTLEEHGPGMCHSVELMSHPGYPGTDPDAGCGIGADDFSMSEDRRHEMNVLTGTAIHEYYVKNSIELVDGCST